METAAAALGPSLGPRDAHRTAGGHGIPARVLHPPARPGAPSVISGVDAESVSRTEALFGAQDGRHVDP